MNDFKLSVIIPVFNEEENISPLLKRLLPVVEKYQYEVIFVNDGSQDETVKNIKSFSEKNKNIKLISFYRNFGHQVALTAGYEVCRGDAVVSIDADLQDPPEVIDKMVKSWQKGNLVVYGKRGKRWGESFFKKYTASAFYKLINLLSDVPIPQEVGDFRLIDRKVVDFINELPEKSRFLRGLVAWGNFPSSYVAFDREKRLIGQTHYPLSKMINLALEGMTSFSTKPLRMATYFGITAGVFGFLGIIYELIRKAISPQSFVIGWTGLFTAIMFLGGIQLITIGIIGEYVGKIYKEVQRRPRFLIKEKVNL